MSTKANPKAIGAFVLGALVLLVAAILLFGGGQFVHQAHFQSLITSPFVHSFLCC